MAEMIANTLFLFVLVAAVAGLGRTARPLDQEPLPTRPGEYDLGRDLAAGVEFLLALGRAHADRLDRQLSEMNQAGRAAARG